VPAIVLLLPAAVLSTAATSFAQTAAPDCITSRGSAPPPGSHWYFRVDRTLHRHCWYLAREGTRPSAAARSAEAGTARAELPTPLPPPRPALPAEPLPGTANAGAPPAQMAAAEDGSPRRWRHVIPGAAASEPGSELTVGNQDADAPTTSAQDDMPLVWPPLTAADMAAIHPRITSPERMLVMLAVAFACAGMMVRLIVRRPGARPAVPTPAVPTHAVQRARPAAAARRPAEQATAGPIRPAGSRSLADFKRPPSRDSKRHRVYSAALT
jgi:hypothetical protein